jgi:roadblock/LC7 domain-containing protein
VKLDMELSVPEYETKLYYHNSRPPNAEMVKKICESLELARDIVNDAQAKLSYALTDPTLHADLQARWKDTGIPDTKVAKEAALYHFKVDAPSPQEEFGRIIGIVGDTLDGLDAVNGDVTLSDVLSRYGWDLYKDVREELLGESRPERKDLPTADKAHSGYVQFKGYFLEPYLSARFSPDRRRVVTVSEDGSSAQVWNAETRQAVGQPMEHSSAVYLAQFSPDGQRVVTALRNGKARVWNGETGEAVGQPMQHHDAVYSAQFSLKGQRLVTASGDKTAQVWNAETGEAVGQPMEHSSEVYSAQFSPDGQQVVTGSEDGKVQIWDAAMGKLIGQPMQHSGAVYSAQFSPDGRRLVTASGDKTARVWNAETGEAVGQPMRHDGNVRSAQFSPNGKWVVTASDDETARVWNAETGEAIGRPMQHDGEVYSAQFSSDWQYVVTTAAGDNMEKEGLWDAATGKALGEQEGPVCFTQTEWRPKGIHIEFSNATKYPRLFLAMCIVHEATHKFAHTEDHAYTEDDNYKTLTTAQRIENADSFAYVAISIFLDRLIKDLEQFLKAVPQNDQTGPKRVCQLPKDILDRAKRRPKKI